MAYRLKDPRHEFLGKICNRCKKRYIPTGKRQTYCEACNMIGRIKNGVLIK